MEDPLLVDAFETLLTITDLTPLERLGLVGLFDEPGFEDFDLFETLFFAATVLLLSPALLAGLLLLFFDEAVFDVVAFLLLVTLEVPFVALRFT